MIYDLSYDHSLTSLEIMSEGSCNQPVFIAAQYQALKDEHEQLKVRTASDAQLQQKLQQDLINLEKVSVALVLYK